MKLLCPICDPWTRKGGFYVEYARDIALHEGPVTECTTLHCIECDWSADLDDPYLRHPLDHVED